MAEEQLHGPQVFRTPIDQGRLGAAHGVRAVVCGIEPDHANPAGQDTAILSGREVWPAAQAGAEEVVLGSQRSCSDPVGQCTAREVGDFELYWAMRLLLHDDAPRGDPITVGNIAHPELHEIAAPELTIDGQVEQRELPNSFSQLQSDADGPNVLEFEGAF